MVGKTRLLTAEEIQQRLRRVPEWTLDDRLIRRRFTCANFAEAMGFVNRVAERAEAVDHHPDITINWNRVTFELTTHFRHGLTDRDFDLAEDIDRLAPPSADG